MPTMYVNIDTETYEYGTCIIKIALSFINTI